MQLYHCYWSMSHTISHLIGHFACVYVALLNKAVSDHYYIILKNIYSILVNQTLCALPLLLTNEMAGFNVTPNKVLSGSAIGSISKQYNFNCSDITL